MSALAKLASKGVTAENVSTVLSVASCAVDAASADPELQRDANGSIKSKVEVIFGHAADCIRTLITGMGEDVTEIINGLSDDLKVIPEGIETSLVQQLKAIGVNADEVTIGLNSPSPPCTPADLSKAIRFAVPGLSKIGPVTLSAYACQDGYALADIEPTGADAAFFILKPNGTTWESIYGPAQWYPPCQQPPSDACGRLIPIAVSLLRSLLASEKQSGYKIVR
jgi:hypothetical protein